MRYAYAITAAMLLGGAAATVTLQQPVGAQVAQNAPSQMAAVAPRGAPMSFADLAAKLQPAVVNISTTQKVQLKQQQQNPFAGTPFDEFFRRFGGQGGQGGGATPQTREAVSLGSGFIISADGFIVTNNHVISGVPTDQGKVTISSIKVTLTDRKEYTATVVAKDPTSDLAVLKIDAKNLPFVQFGDSTKSRVGDWVIAIGNPFALGGTVTAGIVSAIHRSIGSGPYDRYIQTDAAINQGNSGGPMFDLNGNVIGINTAIYSPTGGNVGIGFAIPAEQAKPVIQQLMKGTPPKRGYFGVVIQPMDDDIAAGLGLPKDVGEIVARVEPGQPAARAGIQQGDVIVKVNGTDVTPDNTLSYIVAGLPVGSRVPVEYIRNGKHATTTAVVTQRPSEDQLASAVGDDDEDGPIGNGQDTPAVKNALGVTLQSMSPGIARQIGVPETTTGAVITSVDPSSDAATKGLQPKDIIVAVGQRRVATVQEAAAAVEAAKKAGMKTVLLLVQRGTRPAQYLGVDLTGK
ncbi:Do family serine endopeptidase [Sphingomonas sp. AP4-R1]|uniref:Do family serine endopeptidase n=1 Tax=Sphingomonas sp. AP4-R1 TaxID=2735134 RepID=UPI001493B91F|nr:Do family serine endopeptidase [Sphingomonas sp. AP4-R1]QJU56670.1 Do family serine endopeptidase [Sphingomonas sp. AP4-R1]